MNPLARCCLLPLAAVSTPILAAEFCVANGGQLQAALDTADGNFQDDIIRLRPGLYRRTATGVAFSYVSSQNHGLTLSGGWNAGCQARDPAADTRLDGEDVRAVMLLDSHPSDPITIALQGLTFENGRADVSNRAGGLTISNLDGHLVDVVIENSRFVDNRTVVASGGGLLMSGGALWLRNNLFVANHAAGVGGAAAVTSDHTLVVVNHNSVLLNTSGSAGTPNGGLFLGGSSALFLANNILALNDGLDLYALGSDHHERRHNTIEDLSAPAPDLLVVEFTSPPQFAAGLLNFNPSPGGAQYNSGDPAPPGGIGDFDVEGRPRVAGGRVDMGAYESAVLFYDGFDVHPAH